MSLEISYVQVRISEIRTRENGETYASSEETWVVTVPVFEKLLAFFEGKPGYYCRVVPMRATGYNKIVKSYE